MELPKRIAGADARQVREMFKTLMEAETEYVWKDGAPSIVVRRVTPDLIVSTLNVSATEAQRIQMELVAEGWIESDKFVPTTKGMALAQHIDRPRLPRAEAERILDKVVDWADRINAQPNARVKVKAIHLFGSLERGAPDVADIDLFVEFTTMDLGMELQPEDTDCESELVEELVSISEYISPSNEFDRLKMSDVPCRQVYPRP